MEDHEATETVRGNSCVLMRFILPFCGLPGLTLTASVCKKIASQLIGAMGKQEDVSVQLEALDILSDMLGRYRFWSAGSEGSSDCSPVTLFHDQNTCLNAN